MDLLAQYPELRPFVLSNVRETGIKIGTGAYGSVEEVALPGAICAAKKIHHFFQDPKQVPPAAISKASAQFVRECQLMSTLRHPNIVQFLGLHFLPGSRLPSIVMERLLTSLHDLLDPEMDPPPPPDTPKPFFPLSLKSSILHNVACGLAYLHERLPPVIHRDLSARNVLLNSGMVAKIADLGVARIVPRMRVATTLTMGPGAIIYMPPEAMALKQEDEEKKNDEQEEKSEAKYDASIDVFSFGVVAIFTLCQTFPCDLLAPTYREGRQHKARTELERRERYVRVIYSQLREEHPLLRVIEGCLDFPEERPSIREVLRLLEEARAEVREEQTDMNKLELLRALQSQPRNQAKDRELAVTQQQLRQKEEHLTRQGAELTRAEETIRREQQQLRLKEEELQSSEREKQTLRQQLRQKEEQLRSMHGFQNTLQQRELETQKVTVNIHNMMRAPCAMTRGSATTDGQFAYFSPYDFTLVFRYECSTEQWEELPSCPCQNSGLVIIDRELTAVGGVDGSRPSNKLLTLRQREWVEKYPPMNTARTDPAVVSSSDGDYLIVIGGDDGGGWTATVELFQVRSRRWYKLTDVPHRPTYPSTTICGDLVHVIGEGDKAYSCCLQALPSSDQPIPAQSIPHLISWTPLPSLPVTHSTAATLCGELVLVGGKRGGSPVNSIHQLVEGQWVAIGSMACSRNYCLVASPSQLKIIIVGGYNSLSDKQGSVEECVVV